jgi:hypothetical protein
MTMTKNKLMLLVPLAAAGLLAGCATSPAPNLTAEVPYCQKSSKGRVIACTKTPAPNLNADAQAKLFAPDPSALTVYIVRRNWGDGSHFLKVRADGGAAVETLPETMVRMKLRPGQHTITFEFEGREKNTTVAGLAGDVRFLRINGMAWSWKSTFDWAVEPETATRERALKARLVAEVAAR